MKESGVAHGAAEVSVAQPRERGYWGEALRELSRDGLAMFGLFIVVALILGAVFAPLLSPHDPTFQYRDGLSLTGEPMPPGSPGFVLGTDALGRDIASRLLRGARTSLLVGIGANILAALIGIVIGGFWSMSAALTSCCWTSFCARW